MAPPSWLAGALAAILLLIAGYCATRLVAAHWWRRSTDHGVDAMHAVMGVAMAAMLIPRLNPLQSRAWAVLFAAGTVWFGWQTVRGRRHRPPGPDGHHGAHVLSCAAMVCMLAAGPGLGAPTAGRGALPGLALILAVAVAVSVVVSTDRLSALQPAPAQTADSGATPAPAAPAQVIGSGVTAAPAADRPVLCPRLAACCQIVMGVAMAYMLILMV
jgi:hypothetical protein